MNDFIEKLDFYIAQYDVEKQLFIDGRMFKLRGWLKKDEFMRICLWKSRRPKQRYLSNDAREIMKKTKMAFAEPNELKKINYLTSLKGVQIATASAILSVVDPKEYPIIDVRCIQALNSLGAIDWKWISEKHWLEYLQVIRNLSKKLGKDCREIEKGLFAYNVLDKDQTGENLYT